MRASLLQAELKPIGWSMYESAGYDDSSVDVEQPEPCSHAPAPSPPVPQQKCQGPRPWEGPSIYLLPSTW